MTNKYSAAALLLFASFASAQAQDAAKIANKVVGKDGQPELVQFSAEGKAALRGLSGDQVLRQHLTLSNADQMVQRAADTDQLGMVHQRFAQYYQGIRVEHADYLVHSKAGTVESINGDFEKISGLSVTPSVSEKAALGQALNKVGAKKYMWQTGEANAEAYRPTGELVIVRDARVENGPQVLAWKFNVYAAAPISRAYVYVNAHTGDVVLTDNIIKHAAATGTFATAYSGTRSFADGTTTGGYYLRETTRGLGIQTFNCKKSNSYTSATDFIDADNSWTEYNNANFDNVAGDAHVGAQATYDYWKNVHGRNSFDNAGAIIKSYVHFDDVPGGAGYENAYWDGVRMTYGDGATRFRPLTALDVCGHEIGHAVCEKTANLTYSNESGAMNEGLSDIWGASIEAYAVGTLGFTSGGVKAKSTWLIGEEIDKQQAALRSMSDPKSLGQPAYYKGQYWYTGTADNGGVHTNSGVLNHWYYILAVGKSGTNEGGGAYTVTGVGLDAAAKITYRMESVYMTASSTYSQARTYAIQAATDLYGAGSAQVTAVTNAWFAVGVGAAAGGGGGGTVTYCTSKGTSVAYEYLDYVALGTLARTSGADAGYYNGTALTAPTITGGTSQTVTVSAGFVGTAYSEYVKVYIDYNKNGVFTDAGELVVNAAASSVATNRSFAFTVPTSAKNGTTRMRVVLSDNSATTSCGSYSYGETEDYTVNITGATPLTGEPTTLTGTTARAEVRSLSLYPNPATDVLNLTLSDNATISSVAVYDLRGARVEGATFADGTLRIGSLAKGMYTLTVSDGEKVYHQRFVKE
ncbi:M4 family metallopeptidase [Hymenobacter sp. DH14]|uniref:M4 family metallopeptidase n=1 Tax=Hymenobacter cyanobacteriorum TaxID=2926463 RepID=A0A9X1VGC8_9BACT|nr:M4 family metallopeptidase [Hymenobacter cyanobacteriorum]MCI1188684.1 M4 family metallopeptidase [Hymenobacter cyanobacteriorum]